MRRGGAGAPCRTSSSPASRSARSARSRRRRARGSRTGSTRALGPRATRDRSSPRSRRSPPTTAPAPGCGSGRRSSRRAWWRGPPPPAPARRASARALAEGYAFLRALENRLRLEHNQPLEVTAADPAALLSLARRLGYDGTDAAAVAALRADHARHGEAIRAVYDRHFASGAR